MATVNAVPMNTTGAIAREAGCPVHAVEYLIMARGFKPVGRAGNARVFDDEQAARMVAELRRRRAERTAG